MTVMGVDGCRAGWIGVVCDGRVFVAATIAELVALVEPLDAVAVDIPIGLPVDAPREVERLARRRLPGRASTIFNAPALATLECTTYAEANAVNKEALGLGLSRQSFALLPAIADVARWLADEPGYPVVEAHPEVCFAQLAGEVLRDSKHTPVGLARRRELLVEAGVEVPARAPRGAGEDDLFDAAAVSWTAARVVAGTAERLPPLPRDVTSPALWV